MTTYTLTLLDTSGIQDYLFSSNNLPQNAGASYLVDCATRTWVGELLQQPHNVIDLDDMEHPFNQQTIERDGLNTEVLYAGGGNTAILFCDKNLAIEFAQKLTAKILVDAPGLSLSLVHKEFTWEEDALGGENGVMAGAFEELTKEKQRGKRSFPVLGLGVSSRCAFTDLPAVDYNRDGRPVSSEAWAKFTSEYNSDSRISCAYKRLIDLFFAEHPDFRPARDFDDLGRSHGESSYVAIVHADGNGMGSRIASISNEFSHVDQNRTYITAIRSFSDSIRRASFVALKATVDRVVEQVRETKVDKRGQTRTTYMIDGQIELVRRDGYYRLPIRPIVFGGDDITFVCDGRLGLSLAAYFVQQFSTQILSDGLPAYCRAGVAIVHTHYPFARGYKLAEDLCKSAKRAIKEWQSDTQGDGFSAVDWHYAMGGLVLDLDEVRRREYTGDVDRGNKEREKDLLMRPLLVGTLPGEWRTWSTFTQLVREFKTGNDWRDRRNKVKALRDALRKGPQSVEQFLSIYRLDRLPIIDGQNTMSRNGWQANRCGYFDSIEAMDTFIDLTLEDVHVSERGGQ